MKSASSRYLACFALLFATMLSACGDRPDTAPVVVSAIVITSPDGAIPVTGTMQFTATVTDAQGNTLTTTPTWTIVNGGGTITSAGLFTAGDSVGTFTNTVVATIGSVTSASSITVSAGGLATITIAPAVDTLTIEGMQEFAAIGHDAFGHVVDIPRGLVWSVSSPTAGTIDTSGYFSAGTVAGPFMVTATSGAILGHASVVLRAGPLSSITVSPDTVTLAPNATKQYTAVGKDAHGNVVAITPVWAAIEGGTVSNTGLFTAGETAGTFAQTVSATSGLIAGSATVFVSAGPLTTITVTPANTSVFQNGAVQYAAAGHDAFGNAVTVSPTWTVGNATAGTISVSGQFSASQTAGNYPNAIVATSGSITGATGITVMMFIPICVPVCGNPCFPFCFP